MKISQMKYCLFSFQDEDMMRTGSTRHLGQPPKQKNLSGQTDDESSGQLRNPVDTELI